jgi:hypothetical protein
MKYFYDVGSIMGVVLMPSLHQMRGRQNYRVWDRGYIACMGEFRNTYKILIYFLTAIGLTPGDIVQYTFTHKQHIQQHS